MISSVDGKTGDKTLSEPTTVLCFFWKQILIKLVSKQKELHIKKNTWIFRLQNGGHFGIALLWLDNKGAAETGGSFHNFVSHSHQIIRNFNTAAQLKFGANNQFSSHFTWHGIYMLGLNLIYIKERGPWNRNHYAKQRASYSGFIQHIQRIIHIA